MTGLNHQKRGVDMDGNKYRPLPRIILATALAIGFGVLVWRNRPAKPPQPVIKTNIYVVQEGTIVSTERAGPDPADTFAGNVIVYSDTVTNSEPVIDHDHFPFTILDDPWKDMDPSEISQKEHERWLKEKQAHVMQEARAGFAEREAMWKKLKEEQGW